MLPRAFASQDVTPPVISLTMPELAQGVRHSELDRVVLDANSVKGNRNKAAYRSVTCEVGTNAADEAACPKPTCKTYDHHDGALTCKPTYILVNDDGTELTGSNVESDIKRGLRSEWLLKYDATDLSGNAAETVSFTMIFQDTRTPALTTEFGHSNWETTDAHAHAAVSRHQTFTFSNADKATHSWMESCYGWSRANAKSTLAAQCFYDLSKTPSSTDAYDGNVSALIRVRKCYRDSASQGCSGVAWTLIQDIQDWKIDTRLVQKLHIVEYESCDKAGIFGYQEENNCGVQRNVINIDDDTKPLITRNQHANVQGVTCTTDAAGGDQDCEIECRREGSLYQEPGAQCYDARESWLTDTRKDEDADVTYTKNNAAFSPMSQIGTKLFDANQGDQNDWKPIAGSRGDVYVVHYNCNDGEGQQATEVFRTLTVKDTTPPVIAMHGPHKIENSAGSHISAQGSRFEKSSGLDMGYSNNGLGDTASSHVVSCTDTCDPTPFITAELHKGFDCGNKFGDGKLSNFDEYAKGHYSILYTCYDHYDGSLSHYENTHMDNGVHSSADGRTSLKSTVCRNIDNVDHTHPIIQILGADDMTLEATHEGNYVDDGATCSDQVDGVISQNVEVSGDVVNLSKVGAYTVTYHCKDSAGNAAPPISRVVTVAHTTCPRCTMNQWAQEITHEASFPYTDAGASCSDGIDGTLTVHVKSGEVIDAVQLGKRLERVRRRQRRIDGQVRCHVPRVQLCGFVERRPTCRNGPAHYKRTVVVRDSLKPVMEVRYANKVVAVSAATDTSVKHTPATSVSNPAKDFYTTAVVDSDATVGHPEGYMAEAAQGSSTWLLAAAGAAVAGLALLGMSQRRAAVVSVPV